MKTVLFATLLAAAAATLPARGASVARAVDEALRATRDVRVIALLATGSRSEAEISRLQQEVIERSGLQKRVTSRWSSVPGFSAVVNARQLARLRNDPAIATIEHDGGGRFSGAAENVLAAVTESQMLPYDGSGITVAVLDSGVMSSHPDLREAVVQERCYCRDAQGRPCCPNGAAEQSGVGAARDDFGHGTYVASVIASKGVNGPRGLAPGSKIVAIRVAEGQGKVTWTSQVVSAIDWILTDRPDVRVVNMSFALGSVRANDCDRDQPVMAEAVRRMRARGIVVVSASGNDGEATGIRPPSCIGGVISVGGIYERENDAQETFACRDPLVDGERVACFSNASPLLDLLAPGAKVTSATENGATVRSAGTSFASPYVAAAAAILLQKNPLLTPDAVERLLKTTGRPLLDERNGTTYPRLDVRAAIAATPEVSNEQRASN